MSDSVLTTARNYLDLTKPRLLPMVLFSGLPVLGMAAGGWPSASFTLLVMTGIALAAASANTLNAYIERDKDALMERTKTRPLPAGLIAPRRALVFTAKKIPNGTIASVSIKPRCQLHSALRP